ncbi:2,5-diamino-6-(ribosylamino)-4(3H)-pyrimidinone 5'-phosphate reductase [Halococcoides cellulosivorans]|uniref:2,5-diamino-6-(ribosylamino)-4(3H)-pyrimidinone 5'-phosphate reductase n=1 Tax=Halococcoides cellulosivorans TaxID=1679096 RepID=A0A2R4WZT2_9EURY|nr:2,5-diamino-6-(ribosylamino)-4(3H)-pyrimidinone 5'-phosphate reductase [Halococcoides cellulosivorans]AWB27015.1 2,5-diamino-6-(ribosylamino)-4(3H)-pyrimidinone 5'-phosphate reductase [Halococcoides cellulosivorans]
MEVIVNVAMSADGKLATPEREQIRISGPEDFDRVDAIRAEVDAVAVGVGTVLADDPSLTVDDPDRIDERRACGESAQPTRVVVDSRLRTPTDAQVLDDAADTVVFASAAAPADRIAAFEQRGATVIVRGDSRVDLPAAVDALGDRGVDAMLIEGGGELLASVFATGLADRVSTFVGPLLLGGREAPTLADGPGFDRPFPELALDGIDRLDDGVVLYWSVLKT